jgi:hypothetical protein
MYSTLKEAAMAESMVSTVTGLIILIVAAILIASHYRYRRKHRGLFSRHHPHRLWDRMRHRH